MTSNCDSCGGLNLSCPKGCERDPKTGELLPPTPEYGKVHTDGSRSGGQPRNPADILASIEQERQICAACHRLTEAERQRFRAALQQSRSEPEVMQPNAKLTDKYLAMTPLQKWETLCLHGLIGYGEPWIEDMRQSLKALQRSRSAAIEECHQIVFGHEFPLSRWSAGLDESGVKLTLSRQRADIAAAIRALSQESADD